MKEKKVPKILRYRILADALGAIKCFIIYETLCRQACRVKRAFTGQETHLGGGAGTEGIYGSLTASSMAIIGFLLGLGGWTRVLDYGSGIGMVTILLSSVFSVKRASGLEIDRNKIIKSLSLAQMAFTLLQVSVYTIEGVIDPERHVPGCNVLFTFWEGFSDKGKWGLTEAVRQCKTIKYIVIVQEASEPGFQLPVPEGCIAGPTLFLMGITKVHMEVSGKMMRAHLFRREAAVEVADLEHPPLWSDSIKEETLSLLVSREKPERSVSNVEHQGKRPRTDDNEEHQGGRGGRGGRSGHKC